MLKVNKVVRTVYRLDTTLCVLTASASLVLKTKSTEDEKVFRIEVDGKLLTSTVPITLKCK